MIGAGKISCAIGLLAESQSRGVLSLSHKIDVKKVENTLKALHSNPCSSNSSYISNPMSQNIAYLPSIFEQVNVSHVRTPAMKTHGSHVPSGLDAKECRRTIIFFKDASSDSSRTIAKVACRITTKTIESDQPQARNACRLVPLNKSPVVRGSNTGNIRPHHQEMYITGSPRSRMQKVTMSQSKKRNSVCHSLSSGKV